MLGLTPHPNTHFTKKEKGKPQPDEALMAYVGVEAHTRFQRIR